MSEIQDPSSSDFLRQFRENRAEALRDLYRLHQNAVEVVVKNQLGKKPVERFEDTCQQVWLGAIEGAESFEGKSKVRTWIIQIARNTCAYVLRVEKRRKTLELETDEEREPEEKDDSIPEKAEVKTLAPQALAALATLPPEEVRAFLGYYVDEMSYAEIALAEKVHENTARNWVDRVLAKLRGLVVPLEKISGDPGR
ncbi:MAG TPA: sigma-70 family RNA polymerase sigma factor [Planctomycetota bacterium]|nr:sigma-70 family RNA polymerase sigma factor [Planctomycetota bacterium]